MRVSSPRMTPKGSPRAMVAIKSSEADAFVARARRAPPIVLVFGPDAGLVSERVGKDHQRLGRRSGRSVRAGSAAGDLLASEPSRLAEEAHTVPLFGGRRAVWVKAGSRNFVRPSKLMLATPPKDCRIVIEAGDLRSTAPLRALAKSAKMRRRESHATRW